MYVIDPRKNWAMAEEKLVEEKDPRRRQILATLILHAKAESAGDFATLMSTVAANASYRSYATADEAQNQLQSPQGKDGIAEYYRGIVSSGCHRIEHDTVRMVVGQDEITTEGELKMAYPGAVLKMLGVDVPEDEALYLYQQRLLIVWEFDADGLVLCEDSYSGPGPGFEGIAQRKLSDDDIFRV